MSRLDSELADIAARQRLLITLGDVRRVGGDHTDAQRRIDGGRWRTVDRGVYLITGAPLDWKTRLLAATLCAGDGVAGSHLAAGRLHGLSGFDHAMPELSIPRGRRYRRPDVRTHESTDLGLCRIVQRDGIPVTDPSRTMLDLGRYLGLPRLTRTVEQARRRDLVTWSSLIATLAVHARRGRHGTRRLRAVILSGAHRQEVTDTDMELLVLGLLRDAALPEPELHHQVRVGRRFVAEVDLAYPDQRIAIECDGDVHLRSEVRERDLPRQNDLVLAGWTVLRFSWERSRARPDAIVREVREALRRAA